MKLIAVTRVSTSKQWSKGSSIQDQVVQIEEYARNAGHEVAEVIRIQMSGRRMTLNQGQLEHALRRAEESGAELAVSRLDRLSRSQIALLQLKEASDASGVDVHVCSLGRTIKSISSLEFSMMAMIADNERRNIQERVKRACKDRIGPIGQTLDARSLSESSVKVRQANAMEWAKSINLKEEIVNAGDNLKRPTLANVSSWLNGRGTLTRRGKLWSAASLHQQMVRFGWDFKGLVEVKSLTAE